VEFQEDYRTPKRLSQLRVEEVKTLLLYGYHTMLNTEPLIGEGVQLFFIVFYSIAEKTNEVGIL